MVESRTEQLDQIFHALAHPVRRKILRRIARRDYTVTELAAPFDMSLEAVSKHVQVLERARLVRRTRVGRTHRCKLGPAPLRTAARVLADLAGLWNERLDALEQVLLLDQSKQTATSLKTHRSSIMSSIKDEIRIHGTANKVYEALTREAGYRGWWNAAGEVEETVGGEANLHFVKDGTPVNMRFHIDEMKTNERVRWTCVAHDMPNWVGTVLTWRLQDAGGAVLVSLEHSGWKEAGPEPVAQGWKHFLGSLKSYVETGTGQPW